MDSGASAHMCPDCSYFSSYQKIDPPRCIWVADNCTIEAISVRDIEVQTFLEGRTHAGMFKGVLHLPDLSESLLSTTKMGDVGITTILTPKHADLVHTASGKLLTCTMQERNLYQLKVEVLRPKQACVTQDQNTSKALLTLWHRRLSHISKDMVQQMARLGIAIGMTVDGNGTGDCSTC